MQKILNILANVFVWNICSISCDSLEWTNPDHTLVTNHPDIVKSQKSLRGFRTFWARHLKAASHRICRKWRTRLCPSCSNVMSMSNCHEKDIYKYKTFCTWESEPNNSKKQVLERKNIARIANAVQVTIWLWITNSPNRSESKSKSLSLYGHCSVTVVSL